MRIRILLIGSIIFASNVALGDIVVALPQPVQTEAFQPSTFEHEVAASLVSRGLEAPAAAAFAKESAVDTQDAMLLIHMITTKLNLDSKKVYAHIASQALFRKRVDLRAYADVVAMVQQIKGAAVSRKDLKSIEEYLAIV
ncbi:hypothetical protein KKE54_05890 [bacterium]|jgi:hypothetical protein|nr:hypothetical protein [bacterium]